MRKTILSRINIERKRIHANVLNFVEVVETRRSSR